MYIHIYMYTIFGISFVPAREGRCTHGSRERERNRKVRVWWILTYTHIRARCGYFRQKMNINREAAACVMRDFPSDLQINAPVVRLISKGESRDATRTKAFVGRPYVAATFDHPSSATLVVGYARRTRVYIYFFSSYLLYSLRRIIRSMVEQLSQNVTRFSFGCCTRLSARACLSKRRKMARVIRRRVYLSIY